jgi:hypothetical protein
VIFTTSFARLGIAPEHENPLGSSGTLPPVPLDVVVVVVVVVVVSSPPAPPVAAVVVAPPVFPDPPPPQPIAMIVPAATNQARPLEVMFSL